MGRGGGTRLGQTGVPRGRDPPRQHPDPLPRAPALRMQIAALHGPGARRGGPARGRGRRPPPREPRAHLGSVAILAAPSAAGAGAAERATAAAAEAVAATAAVAAGGWREETLASQGARLGQTRGTWGGAGFGPAWGRMVNLEPMHTGEGRGE